MRTEKTIVGTIVDAAREADAHGGAVIATDVEGTIVFWNEAAHVLYGWSSDEVIGQNILSVTPTYNSAEEAARIMERLKAGKEWSGRFIVRHRDGTPLVAHVTDIPVRSADTTVGIIGVSRAEQV